MNKQKTKFLSIIILTLVFSLTAIYLTKREEIETVKDVSNKSALIDINQVGDVLGTDHDSHHLCLDSRVKTMSDDDGNSVSFCSSWENTPAEPLRTDTCSKTRTANPGYTSSTTRSKFRVSSSDVNNLVGELIFLYKQRDSNDYSDAVKLFVGGKSYLLDPDATKNIESWSNYHILPTGIEVTAVEQELTFHCKEHTGADGKNYDCYGWTTPSGDYPFSGANEGKYFGWGQNRDWNEPDYPKDVKQEINDFRAYKMAMSHSYEIEYLNTFIWGDALVSYEESHKGCPWDGDSWFDFDDWVVMAAVRAPARPWVMTGHGDSFVKLGIKNDNGIAFDMQKRTDQDIRDLKIPDIDGNTSYFSTYISSILNGNMSNHEGSSRDYILKNYNDANRSLDGGFYNYLKNLADLKKANYETTLPSSCSGRKLIFIGGSGNLTLTNGWNQSPNKNRACVIVTKKNVIIPSNIDNLDAFIITNGDFKVNNDNVPLVINGSVIADTVNFKRDLDNDAQNPAEVISYDAKYIPALRDMLGIERDVRIRTFQYAEPHVKE